MDVGANKKHVTVIDYGLGNISSVTNMIRKAGGTTEIINDPKQIKANSKLILPGVGSFDQGINNLTEGKWLDTLEKVVIEDRSPILGICLGMQLLCNQSEEGKLSGLGWIDAEVTRFDSSGLQPLKIPHMGWSTINVCKENPLIALTEEEQRFYFVHSYHAVCNKKEDILATSDYGYNFTCAFSKRNIFGMQFHPEKSHRFGMSVFKRFLAL